MGYIVSVRQLPPKMRGLDKVLFKTLPVLEKKIKTKNLYGFIMVGKERTKESMRWDLQSDNWLGLR